MTTKHIPNRLEEIDGDLAAYRNGWVAFHPCHIQDLKEERAEIIAKAKGEA